MPAELRPDIGRTWKPRDSKGQAREAEARQETSTTSRLRTEKMSRRVLAHLTDGKLHWRSRSLRRKGISSIHNNPLLLCLRIHHSIHSPPQPSHAPPQPTVPFGRGRPRNRHRRGLEVVAVCTTLQRCCLLLPSTPRSRPRALILFFTSSSRAGSKWHIVGHGAPLRQRLFGRESPLSGRCSAVATSRGGATSAAIRVFVSRRAVEVARHSHPGRPRCRCSPSDVIRPPSAERSERYSV